MEKQNYSTKEAATCTELALSAIWLYARQGRLIPIKLSHRITVFKKAGLDRFILDGEVTYL